MMKIEKISDSIIKVTLSLNDLEERNIDLNTLNYNTPATQEFFWDLMEQAEEQLGFNLSDSQLIIEPVPDTDYGFVITITKIDEDGDFESIHKYIKSRLKKSDLRVKKKSRKVSTSLLLYSFRNIEDVCSLAGKLVGLYDGESTLYRYRNTYYLALTRSGLTAANSRMFELILSEYGTKITNVSFFDGYLNEYGEKIIEYNALDVIKQYF
jgi:adapter protein MecA 1/2